MNYPVHLNRKMHIFPGNRNHACSLKYFHEYDLWSIGTLVVKSEKIWKTKKLSNEIISPATKGGGGSCLDELRMFKISVLSKTEKFWSTNLDIQYW